MVARQRARAFDDPSIPHPARRYNYWLGGRENYKADRASGDAVAAAYPAIRLNVYENRAFLRRVVRYMTEAGIRQFIDIGPGIPAPDCTHEVAQAIAPETRVLYVDNDPVVIAYSRALLRSSAIPVAGTNEGEIELVHGLPPESRTDAAGGEGGTGADGDNGADGGEGADGGGGAGQRAGRGLIGHVLSDLCDPERILESPETRTVIDLDEPVGLLLVAVAHFCVDDDAVYPAVARLIDALPAGSLVAFTHAVADYVDPRVVDRVSHAFADHNSPFRWRYTFEVARFADGLEYVEPGLVAAAEWHADGEPGARPAAGENGICAWVARKPEAGAAGARVGGAAGAKAAGAGLGAAGA
jgi:hypothetical protein